MIKRRILSSIVLLVYMFGLCGCYSWDTETKSENEAEIQLSFEEETSDNMESKIDFSQGDLYAMFEEANNEPIEVFAYDDYNKDGIHEAFVVTREQEEFKLWYMSPAKFEIISENLEYVDIHNTEIIAFTTKDYLQLQQRENGLPNTLLYSVDNENNVTQPDISGTGYIHKEESGEMHLDVYDAVDEKNDTTQCITYYLYYVLEEGFKEYGAIPIGKEQFLEFEGSQEILNRIEDIYGESQLEITFLYRANHCININITIYENNKIEYRNIVLRYDNTKVSYVSEDILKGKVEIAHMLNIATFPTAFKHPQNYNNR